MQLINPYDKMLADTSAAAAHARRNVLLARAHLDAVKRIANESRTQTSKLRLRQMAASGLETATARQQLINQREQALVELAGLGPNHPGRPALVAQIAANKKGTRQP